MFEPSILVFENDPLDKLLRGISFAYIDIVDASGVAMHLPAFEYYGAKVKPKTVMTNPDFIYENCKVAIVFARTRSNINTLRKAIKEVYKQVCSNETELVDLYVRAHEEGFFTELHGLRL